MMKSQFINLHWGGGGGEAVILVASWGTQNITWWHLIVHHYLRAPPARGLSPSKVYQQRSCRKGSEMQC